MGRCLQQTAISTNIKERLDYSCAIFAPNGDLIANAPHVPVHLGSMSLSAPVSALRTTYARILRLMPEC
jgi:N-methylhydantoinase B/oxoprolinase/acetone carboxylase alpha subunit